MAWHSVITKPLSRFIGKGAVKGGSKTITKEGTSLVAKAGARFNGLKASAGSLTKRAGDTINIVTNGAKTSWKKIVALFGAGGITGVFGSIWASGGGLKDFISDVLGTTDDQTTIIMIVAGIVIIYVFVSAVAKRFTNKGVA